MDLKDRYSKMFLKEAGRDCANESVTKLRPVIWFNTRRKDGGYRLTEKGIELVENECGIKIFKVDFPKDFSITPQILIWLDHYIDSPYFITKKYIKVVREKTAFELFLFSGDIRKLGHSRALAKAMGQNLPSK
jgi:hypothetical protein